MRMRASFVAIVGLVTMSGCEQPGPVLGGGPSGPKSIEEVEMLRTDRANYERAGPITLRFTNRLNVAFGYNLCLSRLERRNGDGDWVGARSSLTDGCIAEQRTLRPGQSVTYSFKIEGQAGTFRVANDLGQMGGISRVVAISNPFTVTRQD